jgi:uncharacterized cupin superfamily protein
MEPYPGVFVSSLSAEVWEPDPEVGGEMHVLCSGHGVESGLSRFTEAVEPVRWTLPGRETLFVLEGAARIEIDDGGVLELTAGDIASLRSLPSGGIMPDHACDRGAVRLDPGASRSQAYQP